MNEILKSDKSIIANEAKVNHAEDLVIALEEELVTPYEDKAERANELVTLNKEKAKRDTELIIANKKLDYQNSEKEKSEENDIIAQTAYAFPGDCEKAIAAGCNDYISKPIDKTILYELINKHINKSRINTN